MLNLFWNAVFVIIAPRALSLSPDILKNYQSLLWWSAVYMYCIFHMLQHVNWAHVSHENPRLWTVRRSQYREHKQSTVYALYVSIVLHGNTVLYCAVKCQYRTVHCAQYCTVECQYWTVLYSRMSIYNCTVQSNVNIELYCTVECQYRNVLYSQMSIQNCTVHCTVDG